MSSVNDQFEQTLNSGCFSFDHSIQYVESCIFREQMANQPFIIIYRAYINIIQYRHIFQYVG